MTPWRCGDKIFLATRVIVIGAKNNECNSYLEKAAQHANREHEGKHENNHRIWNPQRPASWTGNAVSTKPWGGQLL